MRLSKGSEAGDKLRRVVSGDTTVPNPTGDARQCGARCSGPGAIKMSLRGE